MIFIVKGEPQGKARPRFTKSGIAYTPKKTKDYESAIKKAYIEAGGERFEPNMPIELSINAYFQIPKGTPKLRVEQMKCGKIRPTKKPDFDNIAKVVADALNGVAYEDDKQIVASTIYKYYSESELEYGYIEVYINNYNQ